MPNLVKLNSSKIVGRYAPSPTGELHFGNLRTALLAWLHARLQGGRFVVRMEDLDLPRVVVGSADQILRDLEWLGLDWDGPVVYQSERNDLYQSALDKLASQGLTYQCFCSRKDIQLAASAPHVGLGVYPGTCRKLSVSRVNQRSLEKPPAIRIRVPERIPNNIGDFVVKRADTLFAYQLAVTVDDLDQGVTEVVRGKDLLESTPKQVYLSELLQPNVFRINYLHVPLMLDENGRRMSKRDGSISSASWRQRGGSVEELLGYLAFTAGLLKTKKAVNKEELIDKIDMDIARFESKII